MDEELFDPDEYLDAEGWDDEYISEEDVAEDCGCYIDDDGNWVPMDEEMEMILYEAWKYRAMINDLKEKYASGKPEPAPKDQWPEIIAEWKKTKNTYKPWFHVHIWKGVVYPEDVEKVRDALQEHNFDFDEIYEEIFEEDFESALWIDSPMGELINEYSVSDIDKILNSVTIVDDVPYKDGLPAPVYVKYQNALEEYSWIAQFDRKGCSSDSCSEKKTVDQAIISPDDSEELPV